MWDKVARTGSFTDMSGKQYSFSVADLKMIADNYKKTREKAPIVIGHPETDSPAFGWVETLRVNGEFLEAKYIDVSEKIKTLVDNGEYRHKSISLYPDLKRLKHIGFLGAVPPAISGLGEIHFSDGSCTICFAAQSLNDLSKEENRKAKINKLQLSDKRDRSDTQSQIRNLQTSDERGIGTTPLQLAFFQEEKNEKINLLGEKEMDKEDFLEKLSEAKEEIASLTKKVSELELAVRNSETAKEESDKQLEQAESNFAAYKDAVELKETTSRVDKLIAAGKLMPNEKDEVLKLAAALKSSPSFATDNGSSLNDLFWKRFEDRGKSDLLAAFSVPASSDTPSYNLNDITSKL